MNTPCPLPGPECTISDSFGCHWWSIWVSFLVDVFQNFLSKNVKRKTHEARNHNKSTNSNTANPTTIILKSMAWRHARKRLNNFTGYHGNHNFRGGYLCHGLNYFLNKTVYKPAHMDCNLFLWRRTQSYSEHRTSLPNWRHTFLPCWTARP